MSNKAQVSVCIKSLTKKITQQQQQRQRQQYNFKSASKWKKLTREHYKSTLISAVVKKAKKIAHQHKGVGKCMSNKKKSGRNLKRTEKKCH